PVEAAQAGVDPHDLHDPHRWRPGPEGPRPRPPRWALVRCPAPGCGATLYPRDHPVEATPCSGGRARATPRRKIDPDQGEKLTAMGLTIEEVADVLHCSRQTLMRRFGTVMARARGTFKMRLRRAQFIRAVRDRSDTMLIHLGKIYLDQRPGGD